MTHGGKRKGSGRKPIRGEAKVVTTISVTPELKLYFGQCGQSQSEVVEDAVRNSSEFKAWKEVTK
jgi:hypothetical protein